MQPFSDDQRRVFFSLVLGQTLVSSLWISKSVQNKLQKPFSSLFAAIFLTGWLHTAPRCPHLIYRIFFFFFNLYCFFPPRFFRAANPRWVSRTWPAVRAPPLSRRSARPPRRRSSWASCTTPPRGASRWRSSKASTSKTSPPTSHPVSTLSSAFQSPMQQNEKSLRNYG